MFKKVILCVVVILALYPITKIHAEEVINAYDSYIKIQENGTLEITENITVSAEGNNIKRGIYRDFPTKYKTPQGYNKNTSFKVTSVLKDGAQEPYFTENISNGVRLYIGDKNVFLEPGLYTYTLTYNTKYQIGFFKNYDELYFNAIGTGWVFPIENAKVTVELPSKVEKESVDVQVFSGTFGSTNNDKVEAFINGNKETNKILYTLKQGTMLNPNEGLTVLIGFPKGLVTEPSTIQKIFRFIQDNIVIILRVITTLLAITIIPGVYLYFWLKHGRDPKTRGVVRNYDIPKNISPASTRYISKMNFDTKALSATIISLAVKGYLTIKESRKILSKNYTLTKQEPKVHKHLFEDEKVVLEFLFSKKQSYVFDKKNYKENIKLIEKLKQVVVENNNPEKVVENKKYALYMGLITAALFFIGVFNILVIIISIPVHIVFYYALKARTKSGKEIYDQVLGLKEYLSAVEKPRYESNLHKEIPFNIGVYEKYLPYAITLDVEPIWSKRLKKYLDKNKNRIDKNKHMMWYIGNNNALASDFSNNLSKNLTNTISSASKAPGSSSGFSGGSSGGGGGGGGGGGW